MCLNAPASPGMILGGDSVVFTRWSQLGSGVSPSQTASLDINSSTNITGRVTAILLTGQVCTVSRLIYPVSIHISGSMISFLRSTDHLGASLSTSPLPGRRSSTGVRAGVSVSWVSHWLPVTPGWPAIRGQGLHNCGITWGQSLFFSWYYSKYSLLPCSGSDRRVFSEKTDSKKFKSLHWTLF